MNAFQEELKSFTSKKYASAKSQLERDNWGRLDKLCKYALWAAWIMNNRSPFHMGSIRKSARLKRRPEKKKALPGPIHARMILTNNPHAKEYVTWINRKTNFFERPI